MSRVSRVLFEGKEDLPEEKSYKLYAVTFHGHYLEPVREQFILRGRNGLRRRVIVIDFDAERMRAQEEEMGRVLNDTHPNDKGKKSVTLPGSGDALDLSEGAISYEEINPDVLFAMELIQRELQFNADVNSTLHKERQFNIFDYWFETLRQGQSGRHRNSFIGRKSLEKDSRKKPLLSIKENGGSTPQITCAKLKPQRHNKVGRPKPLISKKFIEDEPDKSKIFIIFVGTFETRLLTDLLRFGEPLQAIFHFLPGETAYELLVPNPDRKAFVEAVFEDLEEYIAELRANHGTKPTGIFRKFIPLISVCRAERISQKIYDQLSWACYDVEGLYHYYEKYYVAPFQEINVEISKSVKLKDSFRYVNNLSLQGNYLLSPLPGIASDRANILLYLDMLFTTIDSSESILTEWEMVLLSTPLPKRLYALYKDSVNELAERYADAFFSITKVKKVERLFLEANNKTLVEMVQYVDHERFRHIYLTCLEYKVLRKYFDNDYHHNFCSPSYKKNNFPGFKLLPTFARLYPTDDGMIQRLLTLMDEYDIIDVKTIKGDYKLYNFQRNLNEVIECNRMYVLPSCLCFRDFTLYQVEEFLEDLITPELLETNTSSNLSEVERFEQLMRRHADDYNPDIFVRPKSLKAQRMEVVSTLLSLKSTRRTTIRKDSVRDREFQMAAEALMDFTSNSGVGLPPNHPLLIGYNLDDIRQEIGVKTSKYFFEEGNLQLYEERWCFDNTNKNLSFKVNDNELKIGTKFNNLMMVQPRLRLTTKNEISIRFHEDLSECAKIVLNYPNGLSVYYQENDVEQLWLRSDTPMNEKRRIITPFAAVIVEYIYDDLIVIMRYNGEVYSLYQYEFTFSEEEVEETSEVSDRSLERATVTSHNIKLLLNSVRREVHNNFGHNFDRSRVPKEARLSRRIQQPTQSTKKRNLRRQTSQQQETQSISIEASFSFGQSQSSQEQEKETISNELEFLRKISRKYGLSYKHLILVTSEGRVFNLMINGTCYETMKLNTEEWHDYFANESYAMREDGLRMIWGMNYLKCYHSDGTIITTTVEDVYHIFEGEDDFANAFSQSSSHMGFDDSSVDHHRKLEHQSSQSSQNSQSSKRNSQRKKKYKSYEPYLKTVGEVEEDFVRIPSDPGYVLSNIVSQCIQHANYASVYFLPQLITYDIIHFMMEIKGLDDIVVHRTREQVYPNENLRSSNNYDPLNEEENSAIVTDTSAGGDASTKSAPNPLLFTPSYDLERLTQASFLSEKSRIHLTSPRSSILSKPRVSPVFAKPIVEQLSENTKYEEVFQDVIKVWIGNDFCMNLTGDHFEITILLERNDSGRGEKRDKLEFRFAYTESLQDIFQKIVSRISAFKKYNEPKMEQVYFLERISKNCQSKGLEFLTEIPELGEYHNIIGNTITEFGNLENIMEKFNNKFEWYKKDMKKFPRFQMRSKKSSQPLNSFPMVLDVNIMLKIPQKLRSIDKIHRFADPLDMVNFKKTRYQIKETMSRYIHPHIAKEVHKLYSRNNWRRHREEQKRRRMIENQRTGLYQAILRHKCFPNYFLFTEKYQGKARLIDYFDFCLHQAQKEGCQ